MGPGTNRREQETSDLFAQSLSARVCHHQAGLADLCDQRTAASLTSSARPDAAPAPVSSTEEGVKRRGPRRLPCS